MNPSWSSRRELSAADHAFARFCRTGDADALAVVFDATAPRLAVLAGHLVPGDAQAVEDLVQTTFVEAMRSAERFESGRPVLPWLVTILGRRAANLRRDGRRRAMDALESDPADGRPDPARIAADRECAERVTEAVQKLDAPYREVYVLRVVHGLSPAEIARALDRPLGTVHAQLHRGAERLRRFLPASIAIAAIGWLTARPCMAAVRARVIDAARDLMPVAGTGMGLLGGSLMVKKLVAAAVGIVLVGALWWSGVGLGGESAVGPVDGPAAERTARVGSGGSLSGENDGAATERSRVDLQGVLAESVVFTGRAVAWESGLPIAGAVVTGVRRAKYFEPIDDDGGDPLSVVTGADGRYRLELVPIDKRAVNLYVRADGRAAMVADWMEPLRRGIEIDSGDIPMAIGAELSIRVRDTEGMPVSGFGIQLERPAERPESDDGRFVAWGWNGLQTTAGADGVAGPRSVMAGTWAIEFAEGTGHVCTAWGPIVVPGNRTEVMFDLEVRSPDPARSIAGVVVDEHGVPVEGVEIRAKRDGDRGFRGERTFGGGRFQLCGFEPERGPARVRRVGPGSGDLGLEYEILEPRGPVEPGTTDLRVVVRRRPRMSAVFRVVDGRDGRVVEAFGAVARPVMHDPWGTRFGFLDSSSLRLSGGSRHPGGRLEFTGLPPSDHLLAIVPSDPALQPVCFVEFTPGGDEPIEIALEPIVAWRVRVVDPSGAPVAGTTAELLRGVGRTQVTTNTYARSMADVFSRGISATYLAVASATGTTDADGIAELRSARSVSACGLRVLDPRHLETFVALDGVVDASTVRTVTVEPAARIHGRLVPADLVRALGPSAAARRSAAVFADPEAELESARVELELDRVVDGERRGSRRLVVLDDGRFEFGSLPGGDYALSVDLPGIGGSAELGVIRALRVGEVRDVDFDLALAVPSRIVGVVVLDGGLPPESSELTIGSRRFRVDAGGRFEGPVMPGTYACALAVRGQGTRDWEFRHENPLTVDPGAVLDVRLAFVRKRVDFRVTDPGGAPIAHHMIRLSELDADGEPGRFAASIRLDDAGHASYEASWGEPLYAELLSPVPSMTVDELGTRPHLPLGRVEVPVGAKSVTQEFTADVTGW